jgi:hypothetical protein
VRRVLEDPARLAHRAVGSSKAEARAAELVEAAAEKSALSRQALARIRDDVLAHRSPRTISRRRRLPAHLHPAFVAVLLLFSVATAAGAVSILWRRYRVPAEGSEMVQAGSRPPSPRAQRKTPQRGTQGQANTPEQAATTEVPVDSTPGPMAPEQTPGAGERANRASAASPALVAPVKRAGDDSTADARRTMPRPLAPPPRRVARVASPPSEMMPPVPQPTSTSPLPSIAPRAAQAPLIPAPSSGGSQEATKQTEARMMAQALAQLRQAHDPRGALTILDEYALAFPQGRLAAEALRARLEAVIQLHDLKSALALLDQRPTFAEPLGADLLLMRAELRANVGRCREAVLDFSQILAGSTVRASNGAAERALYGRAVCLERMGQNQGARADLAAYQRRFPAGKFAAEVARLLGGGPAQARP